MRLSVVIKCGDDSRVLRCIDSIDAPAEVVVSGFFSPALEGRLRARGVRIVDAPRGRLGCTTNRGIDAARGERLVIMDADSWFAPGTLASFDAALTVHPLVKARILFESDPSVFGSGLVARTRQHLNDSLGRAYTPGLGLAREAADALGGRFFDDRIGFSEDAELDFRRRQRGLPLHPLPQGAVHHAPVSLWHDLRAAYRVGCGKAQQVQWAGRENDEDPGPLLRRTMRLEQPRLLRDWLRSVRLSGTLYNSAWALAYHAGYYVQRVFRCYR
jgi:glycosyltransferase involved in cell wall biosynthesis